jgi:hypothetical protein
MPNPLENIETIEERGKLFWGESVVEGSSLLMPNPSTNLAGKKRGGFHAKKKPSVSYGFGCRIICLFLF